MPASSAAISRNTLPAETAAQGQTLLRALGCEAADAYGGCISCVSVYLAGKQVMHTAAACLLHVEVYKQQDEAAKGRSQGTLQQALILKGSPLPSKS